MEQLDHSDHYEIVQQLEAVEIIQRFAVRERSVGTPFTLHRVPINPQIVDLQDMFSHLSRWASFRDPRVPLLADAWVRDTYVEYVTHEREGVAVHSDEARRQLNDHGRGYDIEVSYQTLKALTVLHDHELAHKRMGAECFVMADNALIFMRNTGLYSRVIKSAGGATQRASSAMLLASNFMARDVADWAAMTGGLLTGTELMSRADLRDDAFMPDRVTAASKEIGGKVENKALGGVLIEALQAKAHEEGGFNTANEALGALKSALGAGVLE